MVFSLDVLTTREDAWDRGAIVRRSWGSAWRRSSERAWRRRVACGFGSTGADRGGIPAAAAPHQPGASDLRSHLGRPSVGDSSGHRGVRPTTVDCRWCWIRTERVHFATRRRPRDQLDRLRTHKTRRGYLGNGFPRWRESSTSTRSRPTAIIRSALASSNPSHDHQGRAPSSARHEGRSDAVVEAEVGDGPSDSVSAGARALPDQSNFCTQSGEDRTMNPPP